MCFTNRVQIEFLYTHLPSVGATSANKKIINNKNIGKVEKFIVFSINSNMASSKQ